MKKFKLSDEQVKQCWNQNAEVWSDHVEKGWDLYREHFNNPAFLNLIGNIQGKKLLDAGCGEGYNTRIFAEKGAKVTGVDISELMIQKAKSKEEKNPLGISYEVASFSGLKLFPDSCFDTVVSTMALMDAPEYELALKEFYRVLKTKGELFFSISHPCFMSKGYRWLKPETELVVSEYFSEEAWIDSWKFSKAPQTDNSRPFEVPCFPRTLSEYLNPLIETGFKISHINEPRPSLELCEKFDWLKKWREHAALFMHVHAIKES